MEFNFVFVVNSVLLGIGLAMDAFSVSLANGLNEPTMKKNKVILIAGIFGFFQALMPLVGWACVNTIIEYFKSFKLLIPWFSLILLLFIGGKMLLEGIKNNDNDDKCYCVGFLCLLMQGVATSIDALSVGFTIAEYNFIRALVSALIIAVVTFFICVIGVILGKKFGMKFSNKATILGGIILIFIGIEIFITGIF